MAEEFVEDILKEVPEGDNKAQELINDDAVKTVDEEGKKEETTDIKSDESKAQNEGKKASESDADKSEVTDAAGGQKEVEKLAEQLGWNKDHQGPEKVDAATYILRSREIQDTMRDHNKDLKSQVGALQNSVKAIQEHYENVYKAELSKLEAEVTKLKKERRAAIELADVDKVDELDKQIEDLQKDLSKPKDLKSEITTTNPVYDEWIKDNAWYENDDEMAAFADAVAEQYRGAPLERVYSIVRTKVQEVFPDKFESQTNSNSQTSDDSKQSDDKKPVGPASPVEGGSKRPSKTSLTAADLTDDQRAIMNQFVRQGIMTEKQYIADIAKMQEGI